MVLFAPYAHIDILGDFTMDGGVLALSLEISGKARNKFC